MDGSRGHHAKWNKSDTKASIVLFHVNVEPEEKQDKHKTETESQIQRTSWRLPEGRTVEEWVKTGIKWMPRGCNA